MLTRACRFRINVVAVVPSLLHHLVVSGLLEGADFSSVMQVVCGASHTPQILIDGIAKYVKGMITTGGGYGLSEAVRIGHTFMLTIS